MKILKQAHRRGGYLCGFLLSLMPLFMQAQDCIKSISHSILESRSFQVPEGTQPGDLSLLDLVKGKPEQRIKHLELCLQEGGWPQLTTTFERKEVDPFRSFPGSRSVLDRAGLTTYGQQGQVLMHRPAAELPVTPGIQEALSTEAIASFGLKGLSAAIDINALAQSGNATVWQDGDKTYATTETTEAMIDTGQQYMIQNQFKNGELHSSQMNAFRLSNGVAHPTIRLNRSFQPLSNGGRLQVSHLQHYYAFSYMENGQELASYRSAQPPTSDPEANSSSLGQYQTVTPLAPSLELSPNPADDHIQVTAEGRLRELGGRLSIRSVEGRIVFEDTWPTRQAQQRIDIDGLVPGIYIVNIETPYFQQNEKFIKQ